MTVIRNCLGREDICLRWRYNLNVMKLPNTALRAAFGTALHHAKAATSLYVNRLLEEGRAAMVWRDPDDQRRENGHPDFETEPLLDTQASLQLAASVTNALWYKDGDDSREVRICPGIIAVGPGCFAAAHAMNAARDELAATLAAMEGRTVEVSVFDDESGIEKLIDRPLREVAQEAFGAARLHYQQATRCVVTLDRPPDYAGFTWASCRKVFRTTAGKVRSTITSRLDPMQPDPLLLIDIKALQFFKDDHPLAIVRPASLTPKVNLAWTGEDGSTIRGIKRSVLPVIYVGTALPKRLKHFRSAPQPSNGKTRRNDVALEPKPFLTTIAAHRYISAI